MFHFLPFSHFCLHERRGLTQEREHRFIRPPGQVSTPHCRGILQAEEWQDAEGIKHNRVILVATKFYEAVEKENVPDSQQGKTQKDK